MTLLGEAVLKITTDDSDVDKGLENTKQKAGIAGGAIKTALATAGGFVIAQGLLKLPGVMSDIVGAASNMNETVSKSNTVFKENAAEVEAWASQGAADFGLSKQAALDAASGFGNMFDQLGIGRDAAADMSMGIVELATDFASFHNADISQVLDAQSAAFRGEYDSLQRFLPLINAATVEQEALAMTGKKSTKELTAQEKALAVNSLMFKGAGEAMGDFDRTTDSLANRQRKLGAEFDNIKVNLGQKLLPVFVAVAGFVLSTLVPALGKVGEIVGQLLSPAIDAVSKLIKGMIAGFQEADVTSDGLFGTGEKLGKLFKEEIVPVLKQVLETLKGFVPTLLEIGANFLTWYQSLLQTALIVIQFASDIGIFGAAIEGARVIITGILAVIKMFTDFITDNQIAMYALMAVLALVVVSLAPIPIAIAAVVVAIGYLSKNWDEIKAKTESVWNAIPGPIRAALDFILNHVTTIVNGVRMMLEGWLQVVTNIIGLFVNLIQGDWAAAWNNVKAIAEGAITIVKGAVQAGFGAIPGLIRGAISGVISAASELGDGFISGLGDAIEGGADWVAGKAEAVANSIIDAIKSTLRGFRISGSIGGVDLGPLGHTPSVSFNIAPFSFLARGTNFFGGGLAMVGENGPELVELPRGARVHSAPRTRQLAASGAAGGGFGGLNVAHMVVYANDEKRARLAAANVLYNHGTAARARGFLNV